MSATQFECQKCKKKTKTDDESAKPICCGKPMKKISMNICLQPAHAEHARPMSADEPCDEFRGG